MAGYICPFQTVTFQSVEAILRGAGRSPTYALYVTLDGGDDQARQLK